MKTTVAFLLLALPAWAQFTSSSSGTPLGEQQVLTVYTFTGAKGSERSFLPDFQPARAIATAMERGAGIEASHAVDGFGGAGWTKSNTADAGQYFQFTVTPNSGLVLNLSSLRISEKNLGAGARLWSLRSSLDGFSQDLANFTTTAEDAATGSQTVDLGTAFQGLGQAVTFRLYGYSAPATRLRIVAGWPISIRMPAAQGSWYLDSLTVTGVVVPEPAQVAFATCFGLAGFAMLRRKRHG
jgi:hypothetical protein